MSQMCDFGVPTGTPSAGLARTSAKKKNARGISFEQFTGERDPFEVKAFVARHRSATLRARATSGLQWQLALPRLEDTTESGPADENEGEYGGKLAERNGVLASLHEESPAARIKARHEREEESSVLRNIRKGVAVPLMVCCNHQVTSLNILFGKAPKDFVVRFLARQERHAHRGEERIHAAILHARLEHHLYLSNPSELQRIRGPSIRTCGVWSSGSEIAVGTAQRQQYTFISGMKRDNSESDSRPSRSVVLPEAMVKGDDPNLPGMSPKDEKNRDFATGFTAVQDTFSRSCHHLPHSGTLVSSHDTMSRSPWNGPHDPPSQLPRFGFHYTINPAADTTPNAGPSLPFMRSDASGPTDPLPRFGLDEHLVPTALPQVFRTDRDCLLKDGPKWPSPDHRFDEYGISMTSVQMSRGNLDSLCKVVPNPKFSASTGSSIAMLSQLPLPSAIALPRQRGSVLPPIGATDSRFVNQGPATPYRSLVDTHSIYATHTMRQSAIRPQHADRSPPENIRPAPQIMRYGPFQTQQAHQSRNPPLGSGRLQNASKSGMQSSMVRETPLSLTKIDRVIQAVVRVGHLVRRTE